MEAYNRNPMLQRFRKAWAWICQFPKRVNGIYTPIVGISWSKDKSPQLKSDKNNKDTEQVENIEKQNRTVSCAFCSGSGHDPHMLGRCRICHGIGELVLDFDNSTRCRYCTGSGQDPNSIQRCPVCKSIGLISRKSRTIL